MTTYNHTHDRNRKKAGENMTETTEIPDNRRRWLALLLVCAAQLMIVLDGTIVNVALPTIQDSLGLSGAGLS